MIWVITIGIVFVEVKYKPRLDFGRGILLWYSSGLKRKHIRIL